MKNLMRSFFLSCVLALLLGLLHQSSRAAPPPPLVITPELAHKLEPLLLRQMVQAPEQLTPFIAHIDAHADLTNLPRQPSPLAQRSALVTRLQNTAAQTQSATQAFLQTRQRAGRATSARSFWVVNALSAAADAQTILDLAARAEIGLIKADHTRTLKVDSGQYSAISHQDPIASSQYPVASSQYPVASSQYPVASSQYLISNIQSHNSLFPSPNFNPQSFFNLPSSIFNLPSSFHLPTSIFRLPSSTFNRQSPIPNSHPLSPNLQFPAPLWNIQKVRADQVWSGLNVDGSGVVIANLDTGVDGQHPALIRKYRGYRLNGPLVHEGNWFDATTQGYLYPGDGNGHGTHTMGTILGNDASRTVGVAPGAQWIAVKIFTNAGFAQDSWIHAAFQWVIAPKDDPALAPDIISNSWGDDNGFDETFKLDIQAVRAAGILPVFAAGNGGRGGVAGTVGSPGSYSTVLTVGATDSDDNVTAFSGRGPSPLDGGIKPEVVAPGFIVSSTLPGGGYGTLNGTSMATPHVAGIAALIKQAQPTITLSETIYAITSTAVPLSTTIPNNDSGYGRVDAYAAVLQVMQGGSVTGSVTSNGAPVGGALVQISDRFTRTLQTTADSNGRYSFGLSPGAWSLNVSAFGYYPIQNTPVVINSGQTTIVHLTLSPMPTATVQGRLTELGSGLPLSGTVSAQGTPAQTFSDVNGYYTLPLPLGTHTLRATSWQHRVVTATITLTVGDTLNQDFVLDRAPSILLVDSGMWYGGSQIRYYQEALDAMGYLYTLHPITASIKSVPTVTTMQPYSITIWSSPFDSPGYVGAGQAVKKYLDRGGKFFVSGQDVAFWDAGGTIFSVLDYFPDRLFAYFEQDNNTSQSASGINGEPLAGITFTINYTDSARNQYTLDAVKLINEGSHPLITYTNHSIAGLTTSTCVPYRAAYLGFGLEGAGPASVRQQTLQNLIDWMMTPAPPRALLIGHDERIAIGNAGQSVTHTLRLLNSGQLTETYDLTLQGNAWPTALWNAAFTQTLPSTLTLGPCQAQTLGIRTDIPAGTARNISDSLQLLVQTQSAPSLSETRTFISKTPAKVLLVDDDRWYNMETHYQNALRANHIAFDTFDTKGYAGPSLEFLKLYPIVIWQNGYDWFDPLDAKDEAKLAAYLDGGGRLFYTAQDYLFVRAPESDFETKYLGVLSFTNDVTVTSASGAAYSPIGDGFGVYSLTYPYRNFGDYLTPTINAQTAFIGNGKQGSAVSLVGDGAPNTRFKTVFFAFPFETLSSTHQIPILQQIVGFLSPIGDAKLNAPLFAPPTATITYTLDLSSINLTFSNHALVTITLPTSVTFIAPDSAGLNYQAATRTLAWAGALTTPVTLQWRVQGNDPNAWGQQLISDAIIDGGDGFVYRARARTHLTTPRLYYFPFVAR